MVSLNEYVKNCTIENKDFCCLINRHDMGGTWTPIYNRIKKISHIVCPSDLLKNCQNTELNKLGNIEWSNQ